MSAQLGVLRLEGSTASVRFERAFDVAPAELWPFLTEADALSAWITPGCTIEARVGGRILFPWPKDPVMRGQITVFEPPRLLAYTWNEGDVVGSTVRMELRATAGGTLLIVEHGGLPVREHGGFAAGWHAHLDWLGLVSAGGGQDFDQRARFEELAHAYGYPQA